MAWPYAQIRLKGITHLHPDEPRRMHCNPVNHHNKERKQFKGNVLEKCLRCKWWKCRNDWKVWRSWEMEFYFLMQRPIFLLHSTTAPFLPLSIIFWSTLTQSNIVKKHCQRHNGLKGWVLLTKVTSLGHISSFTQWFLGHNCKKIWFRVKWCTILQFNCNSI